MTRAMAPGRQCVVELKKRMYLVMEFPTISVVRRKRGSADFGFMAMGEGRWRTYMRLKTQGALSAALWRSNDATELLCDGASVILQVGNAEWTMDYNRGMVKMRKHMEAEMQEKEEKLRTAAKIMVLKEMESWRSDREQLLDERKTMQKNLSVTEEEKRKLK
eukprot:superscaffoldBa00005192_g20026